MSLLWNRIVSIKIRKPLGVIILLWSLNKKFYPNELNNNQIWDFPVQFSLLPQWSSNRTFLILYSLFQQDEVSVDLPIAHS